MSRHSGQLSKKQEAAIAALATCRTTSDAARQAGIGVATLFRWMQIPSFQIEYRAMRRRLVENAIGTLQQATNEAVDALRRNLTCGVPLVEVRAAQVILEQSCKAIELMDLVQRVDSIEAHMTKE